MIPVTTRLLTKPCRTVKFDIPFAKEHHIPILPLMMESGPDELYERVFGDLHYLDPNARDDTARSFDEKFKNYITSVLIGDELAEKIRKAFDAYIFLSYRKKDRRYANELMRLIHKNEFCRDIAIWYDKFLTPGEGFNEAIGTALHDTLGEIAIAENDTDPEHNFFIGLAYLGGIDVEIDHERAKRLIEGAAEAGLIEAANYIGLLCCTYGGFFVFYFLRCQKNMLY